jgi:pimeloyl-ACP methyl ester carboxylesterase
MSRKFFALFTLLLALPALAAADQTFDQQALGKAAERACNRVERVQLGFQGECVADSLSRRVLTGDIVEYTFDLRLGSGPYDVVGMHRVVRETAPFQPVRTNDNIFLLHGDIWGFGAAFLADPSHNLPVFLAQNGVDVWGMDQRWVRVPAAGTDPALMQDWGFQHEIQDMYIALSVARGVRLFTGNGFDKLNLLGWSRGGMISYAYMNAETQVPEGLRNVNGFIPVDTYIKTNVAELQSNACVRSNVRQGMLASQTFADPTGQTVQLFAFLALTFPNEPSPIFPGLTNYQAALEAGQATFILFPPDQQVAPVYHFTGGTFAPEPASSGLPVPTGLLYSSEPTWLTVLQGAAPLQAVREIADAEAVICGQQDTPFDDHFAEITNPVLYVGAGGGFGEFGIYNTTLLGSTDVTIHIVDLMPDAARLLDFGHADLFLGNDAQTLVWQPILTWLQAH